jgi:hypothetical protein
MDKGDRTVMERKVGAWEVRIERLTIMTLAMTPVVTLSRGVLDVVTSLHVQR